MPLTDDNLQADVNWANALLASVNSSPANGMLIRSDMSADLAPK